MPTDALPPFPMEKGTKVIIDKALDTVSEVVFAVGRDDRLFKVTQADFTRLVDPAWRGHRVATATAPPDTQEGAMQREVEQVTTLPAMPGMANEILKVRNNPYATAIELAGVVEKDPSLTAQLLRFANSPFYGMRGQVTTVEQAILRVLGMDFVLQFSLGMSLGKSFKGAGQRGASIEAFWRHAIYSAALTQALAGAMNFSRRPSQGVAYLAGLLHNFGVLVMGQLFPDSLRRLERTMLEQPERGRIELEHESVGVPHTEMGMWLMDAWDMPKEIIEAVREHHNPDHRSDYGVFANLVCLANILLQRFGIGDEERVEVPESLLDELGLSLEQVEIILGGVMEDTEGLNEIANQMVA